MTTIKKGRTDTRVSQLWEMVRSNRSLLAALERLSHETTCEFWVGGGAIAQTVWNSLTGRAPAYGITDVDVVYYDTADLSHETERARELALTNTLGGIGIPLDVKNQARVHLWYRGRFGYSIAPYRNLEDAVETWPTTATAVALRVDTSTERIKVISPFGLDDLFSLRVRPNRRQITKAIYEQYRLRWQRKWPELAMEAWASSFNGESGVETDPGRSCDSLC